MAEITPVIPDLDHTSVGIPQGYRERPLSRFLREVKGRSPRTSAMLSVSHNEEITMSIQQFTVVEKIQQGLTALALLASNTRSLARVLAILDKVIRCYSQISHIRAHPINRRVVHLSQHMKKGSEILKVALLISRLQELCCPNRAGLYLLQRVSWQKGTARLLLLSCSLLSTIKLAAPLTEQWQAVPKLTKSLYICYYLCTAAEGARIKSGQSIAISISKIFVTTLTLKALQPKSPPRLLALTAFSLTIDLWSLSRNKQSQKESSDG